MRQTEIQILALLTVTLGKLPFLGLSPHPCSGVNRLPGALRMKGDSM